MASMPRSSTQLAALRGWSRLAFDAVAGVVDVVEGMHAAVARLPGFPARDRTRGFTGLVYGAVRGVSGAAGMGLDRALVAAGARRLHRDARLTPRAAALRAALNGVVGDHLAASGNPLAIEPCFVHAGRPLDPERAALAGALPEDPGPPLLLVHGLCMDDAAWGRASEDRGAELAGALGLTPLRFRYNTGLHIAANGRTLADRLEALLGAWPSPGAPLTVVAHSMGGLVIRSACAQGLAAGHAWPSRLEAVVFLGTPHHGAPLERIGSVVHEALGVSPYSAPLARLGRLRSAGITDLRHGRLLDEGFVDGADRFARGPLPRPVPLPTGVRWYAVAGAPARRAGPAGALLGDGLVPVTAALGDHPDPARALGIPEPNRHVVHGTGHLALLTSPAVFQRIGSWLSPEVTPPAAAPRSSRGSAAAPRGRARRSPASRRSPRRG